MSKCAVVTVVQSYTTKFFVEVPDCWDAERIGDEFSHRDIEDIATPYSNRDGKTWHVSLSGDADGCPTVAPFVIAS